MNSRENFLRAVQFGEPEWIPYRIDISNSTWIALGDEVEEIVLRHPRTWPGYKRGNKDWRHLQLPAHQNPDIDFIDHWGSVWHTICRGMVGAVTKPALPDLSTLASFIPPDINTYNGGLYPIDWELTRSQLARQRQAGRLLVGALSHGYFMLRLEYLRGFENLMCDLMDETPEFLALVRMVHERSKQAVLNWIDAGAEIIRLPEDLGSQSCSFVGPELFAKWVTPYHKELHDMAHHHGVLTHFHCDGNIMDVADQIIEIGPDIFNPQDVVNGVDNLATNFKNRMCIECDFDRQNILCYGSPQDIWDLLEYEVKTLGQRKGGLAFSVGLWGEIPPANIEAVVSGIEKLCTYWSK